MLVKHGIDECWWSVLWQAVGHPTGSLCWDAAAFPRDIPVCRLCHRKDAPICLELENLCWGSFAWQMATVNTGN